MKCTIPGRGVKAFGRAIQCLAKIGDELYIEATTDGLSLRTVNSGRSAYACFMFCPSFFHHYDDDGSSQLKNATCTSSSQTNTIKCKVPVKCCLSVFRSSLEKSVDHCVITLDLTKSKLVFVLHCRYGIVKTYDFGFEECQSLQALFSKQLSANYITGPARTLSDVITNFATSLEEATLIATPDKLRIKSYYEEDRDVTRMAGTEITLDPPEFDDYNIGVDTEITFCLKELRAILTFTDSIPHQLTINFDQASRPVVFSFDSPQEYNADFVMATLATTTMTSEDVSVRPHNSNLATTSAKAVSNSNHRSSVNKKPASPVSITTDNEVGAAAAVGLSIAETPKDSSTITSLRERPAIVNGSSNDNGGHSEVAAAEHSNVETVTHNQTSQDANNLLDSLFDDIVNDDVINDDIMDDVYGFTHHSRTNKGGHSSRGKGKGSSSRDSEMKQQLTFSQSELSHDSVSMDTGDITNRSFMLPATPPSKKFKSHFYKDYRKNVPLSFPDSPTHQTVLAPDSDEDTP